MSTVCTAEDTRVQWVFFVLCCCVLPAGLCQLYCWLIYRSEGTKQETNSSEYSELKHYELFKLKPIFVVFYVNLFVMYFFSSSLPATYSAILTVYGVRGPLHMSKSDMVIMTSLFGMGSLSGNIASVFLSRQLSNFKVIASHLSGLVLVGIIFISLGNRYPVALWLLSVTVGYFSGPYIGGVLAWVTELTSLHPKITSLCFLASRGGAMIFPFVGGILYNNFGAQSYLYLIFSIIIAMGTAFSCITAISKALPPALN